MKSFTTLFVSWLALSVFAETPINKTVALKPGQYINLHFDYPELVRISTWDKNEISIQGLVNINGGESDDAFILTVDNAGKSVNITSEIKDMKNIPHRITVTRDGRKMVFKTRADYKKYCDENGTNFNSMSTGVDMSIYLEIKVPKNTETQITSVYGMVEVKAFEGPLTVEATYGGVDAAIEEGKTGNLVAETNYGQIYTNLDVRFNGDNVRDEAFHTYVSAQPGQGPRYSFESKYGNVYLRRSH